MSYANTFQDWRSEKAVLCDCSPIVGFFPNLLSVQHCWFLYYSCMNFCYYSTPFSSYGKCISVFGTSSPSFLGTWRQKASGGLFFFQLAYLFHRKVPLLNSFLYKTSGKKYVLTVCGILILFFILGFILFKCYFYASSIFLWIFCSAHSLSLLLKGSSKQCWKLFACEQGTGIPMVHPKVLCYLEPNWRYLYPCLSGQDCSWKLLSTVTWTVVRNGVLYIQ